jgi:hypothetical protein
MAGHREGEARQILTTFEKMYHEQLPDLKLRQWATSIFM